MIITVSPKLSDLISKIEERERAENPKAEFSWSFFPEGSGASGRAYISWAYKEFDISVSTTTDTVGVNVRELNKYSDEDWGTDPMDSDYEEEESI